MVNMQVEWEIEQRRKWAHRRQLGIPNNRQLMVVACMDERLPVDEALGIRLGDAHVFRNAGGLVTDDVIRSAMLTTNFFNTKEIIIVNHTECGMMSALGGTLVKALSKDHDLEKVHINPALPELKIENQKANFEKWIGMFADVDKTCQQQIELLRSSPLIPEHVIITGYIWQVESMTLRKPFARLYEKVNTNKDTGAK
ncbi:carbonic anhydrase [Candidatus Dependentiae bacterium]|nr:carbonic anhydrase [Candidatus Dependentiae bacterium]